MRTFAFVPLIVSFISCNSYLSRFEPVRRFNAPSLKVVLIASAQDGPSSDRDSDGSTGQSVEVSGKTVTKEIMGFFGGVRSAENDAKFKSRLLDRQVYSCLDGLHILTVLFQCARSKRLSKSLLSPAIMLEKLSKWSTVWSERDISTFVYGIKALEGISTEEGQLLLLGARKIKESSASLSSRSIGNALYGLQGITSTTIGAPELCEALAEKISKFEGDLNGQDIGIGMYGLQGMSSDCKQVRLIIQTLAYKINQSESELDAQALSNALYGLQSMSSDYPEVLKLVNALATKISESSPMLSAQAIGAALYGLQKLSSDKLEVFYILIIFYEQYFHILLSHYFCHDCI